MPSTIGHPRSFHICHMPDTRNYFLQLHARYTSMRICVVSSSRSFLPFYGVLNLLGLLCPSAYCIALALSCALFDGLLPAPCSLLPGIWHLASGIWLFPRRIAFAVRSLIGFANSFLAPFKPFFFSLPHHLLFVPFIPSSSLSDISSAPALPPSCCLSHSHPGSLNPPGGQLIGNPSTWFPAIVEKERQCTDKKKSRSILQVLRVGLCASGSFFVILSCHGPSPPSPLNCSRSSCISTFSLHSTLTLRRPSFRLPTLFRPTAFLHLG
jgi:hypothetical protein